MLHETLNSNKTIKKFLDENYILIMVDIGEKANKPLNRDLVEQLGVKGMGYPSIVVLGKKGERLVSQNSGILEKGRGHDPERIMGFLKAQAPVKKK
jgi:hypothetical protein